MKKIFTGVSIIAIFMASTLSSFAADDVTTSVVTPSNTSLTDSTWTVSVQAQNSAFALKSINVVSLNWIELTFSQPLEDSKDAIREFKIVNKADPLDTLSVVDTLINPKDSTKILLALDKDAQKTKEYEVTIVAIKSADGKNIESWIDSTEVFVVADTTYPAIEDVINNYGNEAPVDLNAAAEVNSTSTGSNNLAWMETWTWAETNNLSAVASDATKLPKTGPESLVILMLSIILWFAAFVFKTNKS